jgi:hypothetical protein
MKKVLSQVIDSLSKTIEKKSTKIVFSSLKYKPIPFDKKYFHEINPNSSQKTKILFVDGGNAPLLESPSFVVEFVRVFGAIFQDNKKIKKQKNEFFLVVKLERGQKNFIYSAEVYPLDKTKPVLNFKFDLLGKNFSPDNDGNSINQLTSVIRRFFELQLAKQMSDELEKADIILLDGTLKLNSPYENKFFDDLSKKVEQKDIILCALSKTTTLYTDAGDSALLAISKLSDKQKWYYHPVVEIDEPCHKADIFITKLHKNSNYVFRFECYKNSKYDPKLLFSLLADNCKDPVFLGYPYGLVYADKHARVTNKEKNYLKTIFIKNKKLEQYSKTLSAHDVLDSIS